jgi:hypothetical protein
MLEYLNWCQQVHDTLKLMIPLLTQSRAFEIPLGSLLRFQVYKGRDPRNHKSCFEQRVSQTVTTSSFSVQEGFACFYIGDISASYTLQQ